MNVNSFITKDYRKMTLSQSKKTKPIQSQSKPILRQKSEVRRQMTDDGEDSKIRFNKGL